MKALKTILILCFSVVAAMGQGVQFDNTSNSWQEVLLKAQKTNKPIFVDMYTTWCGPCKKMDKVIFPLSEVGSYYNSNFISVKIDAEKGWGEAFAKKNRVSSFPTFLYFSQQGDVVLVETGYKDAKSLIKMGQLALENLKGGISLDDMQAKVNAGNADPKFLMDYINRLNPLKSPNALLIEKYLEVLPEDSLYAKSTLYRVTMGYRGQMPIDGMAFQVLYHAYLNYPVKSWELMSPWNSIRSRLLSEVDSAGVQGDSLRLQELIEVNSKMEEIPLIAERERDFLLCRYYLFAGDRDSFMKQARAFAKKYIIEVDTTSLYRTDRELLAKAKEIKYGSSGAAWSYSNLSPDKFANTFYSETARTFDELTTIVSLYERGLQGEPGRGKLPLKEWMAAGIQLYSNNPVFVNMPFLEQKKKYLQR